MGLRLFLHSCKQSKHVVLPPLAVSVFLNQSCSNSCVLGTELPSQSMKEQSALDVKKKKNRKKKVECDASCIYNISLGDRTNIGEEEEN